MRAIETRYKGRLFRSRLEARYAVLFDALGIGWDYEPEGFIFEDGTRYLPDFWLKVPGKEGWGYWVEIKGADPTPAETHKLHLLCAKSGHKGWFFTGTPGEGKSYEATQRKPNAAVQAFATEFGGGGAPRGLRWSAPLMVCTPAPLSDTAFEKAVERALSARFEFGARG